MHWQVLWSAGAAVLHAEARVQRQLCWPLSEAVLAHPPARDEQTPECGQVLLAPAGNRCAGLGGDGEHHPHRGRNYFLLPNLHQDPVPGGSFGTVPLA